MATTATDPWRIPNFFNIIKPIDFGPSSRPEDNTFHDGCTPDNRYPYSGRIYVIYDKTGSNRFYIGSTFSGERSRKDWHLEECFEKLANSKLYVWMRGRCSSRAEAEEKLVLNYIHHVHYRQKSTKNERDEALKEYEKRYINRFFDIRRSLNTNLLSPENRAKLPKKEQLRLSLEEVLEATSWDEAKDRVNALLAEL